MDGLWDMMMSGWAIKLVARTKPMMIGNRKTLASLRDRVISPPL